MGISNDSEALTIMIHFHQSQYRTFKAYYQQRDCKLNFHSSSVMPVSCSGCRIYRVGCVCICSVALGCAAGSALWMPPSSRSVTTDGSTNTKSSKAWQPAVKAQPVGDPALNCMSWSTNRGNCWPLLIVTNSKLCLNWSNASLASCLLIWLISHNSPLSN